MNAWVVYVLRCSDGTLYTGCTNDLPRRLARHQSGKGAAYTRSRRPVRLVFEEAVESKSAALKREYQLKQLPRALKLKLVAERKPRLKAKERALSRAGLSKTGRRPRGQPRRLRAGPKTAT
jgi:putative endonuclease